MEILKNWDEFLKEKRPYFFVITLSNESAIDCLKTVFEKHGEKPVLAALEVFDVTGLFGSDINSLWKLCDYDPSEFIKVIANFRMAIISKGDFVEHIYINMPFKELVAVEELPGNALEPTIL